MNEVTDIEKEYIIGWLACDGCLEKNGVTISLQLQERDRAVVELMAKVFGGSVEKSRRWINGRSYARTRIHDKRLWEWLNCLYKGRLKKDKHFPARATAAFVVGCLDADGCFFMKRGRVNGEFQHASPKFRAGLKQWLELNGVLVNVHPNRPELRFWTNACRQLMEIYKQVPCALKRKADILRNRPAPHKRWWPQPHVELLKEMWRTTSSDRIATLVGRTTKAVQLKAFRLGL